MCTVPRNTVLVVRTIGLGVKVYEDVRGTNHFCLYVHQRTSTYVNIVHEIKRSAHKDIPVIKSYECPTLAPPMPGRGGWITSFIGALL